MDYLTKNAQVFPAGQENTLWGDLKNTSQTIVISLP